MKRKSIMTFVVALAVSLTAGAVLIPAFGPLTGFAIASSPEADEPAPPSGGGAQLTPKQIYPAWEPAENGGPDLEASHELVKAAPENPVKRSLRLRAMKLGVGDIKEPVVELNSPDLATDLYQPVRFMMKEHALRMDNDCASCHHKTPAEPLAGLADERAMETASCRTCHPGNVPAENADDRLSLKAAYHQQCISCHEESASTKAPVDCTSCHKRNVPNHEELFTVTGDPEGIEPTQMTKLCLECHPKAGEEMLNSAHYTWEGPVSEWTVMENDDPKTGKRLNAINNNCISPYGDWNACTKCHTGYGTLDANGEFPDAPENVDCIVCHAEADTYGKAKKGMPEGDVDLAWAAGMVGNTSRDTCGSCHYKAGGGNGRKGTLYNALNNPDRELDVHMGGKFDMNCADCHKAKQHKIAGRHSSVGVSEGVVACTDCHAPKPHGGDDLLADHLNAHVDDVACATCHIPTYSRAQQTRHMWDWRTVGQGEEIIKNEQGKPIYLPDEGTFRWEQNVKPHYDWDNGYTQRYVLGDVIEDMDKPVSLSRNLGSMDDPASKIGPFKLFQGWQPADAENRYLVVPKNTGHDGIWETKKWEEPIAIAMEEIGLPFSGKIKFVETELRFRPRHEVAPKENALSCTQCHTSALETEAVAADTCARCHNQQKPQEIGKMIDKGKNRAPHTLPWEQLGYPGDPIVTGGRFSKKQQSTTATPRVSE